MNSIDNFIKYYKEQKKILEQLMNDYNEKLIIEDNPFIKKNLSFFKDLNSDGKLVRGTLVKLGYSLEKEDSEYSNNLALAYEIFQTSILIHDDIIDRDEKRRGKETIHYRNNKEYQNILSQSERESFGNAIALCMGDYGLYSANKVISNSYKNDKNLGNVLDYFNEIVLKTIKGEMLDVILPVDNINHSINQQLLEKSIIEIYKFKTAYYTIVGPLVCGLLLAGTKEEKIKEIEKFGEEVGIAFQIQDDILGIYSAKTGKVIGSDIKENKQTILYSYIQTTPYKDEFLKYYGKKELSEYLVDKVKELLEISGATQYAIDEMNKHYNKSLKILDNIAFINIDKKNLLKGFVEYLRMRKK